MGFILKMLKSFSTLTAPSSPVADFVAKPYIETLAFL